MKFEEAWALWVLVGGDHGRQPRQVPEGLNELFSRIRVAIRNAVQEAMAAPDSYAKKRRDQALRLLAIIKHIQPLGECKDCDTSVGMTCPICSLCLEAGDMARAYLAATSADAVMEAMATLGDNSRSPMGNTEAN